MANNEESEIPVHSYHRFESLLSYMNDYITHLALVIADLKTVVYGMVGVHQPPYQPPPRCFNQRCEVEYMMGMCRQNMDDLLRVNHVLKGYGKGARFEQQVSEELPSMGNTRTHPGKSASTFSPQPPKSEQNKVGFLTFRENTHHTPDIEMTFSPKTQQPSLSHPHHPLSASLPTDDFYQLCDHSVQLINLIRKELTDSRTTQSS